MSAQPYRYRQSKAPVLSVEERATVATLASRAKAAGPLRIQVGQGRPILVPKALHAQIFAVLSLAAEGTPSAVDRLTLTLTTQQVAERLGVSRPHVVSLIESRKLVGTKVGTHRRVLLADLEAYQSREASSRSKALTSLARQTRKLGLGY
jgi:excisionase family DNA binding protein